MDGNDDRPKRFIELDGADIDAVLDSLAREPRLAVDTESDSFHRYFEKVCLIQISTPSTDWFFDPLRHGMPPRIAALLSRQDRLLVLHGADSDVRALKRSFGLGLGRLFDTSVAASLLGAPGLGLKALLEAELEVVIDKGEQRSDWGRRPLSAEQLEYARQDTRWLLPLADRLSARLELAGRSAWLAEECELIRGRESVERAFDPEAWRKLTGARALGPRGRRALAAAFGWREEVARRVDRPPFRVATNELLVRLAAELERTPTADEDPLRGAAFVSKWIDLAGLRQALRERLAGPDPGARAPGPRPGETRKEPTATTDPDAKARLERLRKARSEGAQALALDPGFLVSGAALERLARKPVRALDELREVGGLTAWRTEAIGPRLLEALRP